MKKKFETFAELIGDSVFKEKVTQLIKDMRVSRLNRPQPKPGFRYVKDAYDRMLAADQLNATFFIKHIEDIRLKRSSLSSETRMIIDGVCGTAYKQTTEFYSNFYKELEKEEPVPE